MTRVRTLHNWYNIFVTNTKQINQQTYDAIAAKYEENYGDIPASREYVDYILSQITNIPNPTILDIGCGSGTVLKQFGDVLPNAKLVGVDFSQKLLDIAKSKVDEADLICHDFATFEPQDKIDVVVATFSLIHSSNEELEAMIPKIYSWLNDGGYFYPAFILGDGEQTKEEALDPTHRTYFNFHNETYLKDLLTRRNFKIVKQKIFHTQDDYEEEDDIYFVLQK